MKKWIVLLSLVISLLFVSCGGVGEPAQEETMSEEMKTGMETEAETNTEAEAEEELTGSVETVTIHSPSLEKNLLEEPADRELKIYLPSDYGMSDHSYPVLYFLPGFEDSHKTYMKIFADTMDELCNNDMIVVVVDGKNKLNGSFYSNSPVIGNWEDYVAKDIVEYVDSNYRTIKEAKYRGIAGHSMGGWGVIGLAMNTEVFGQAYSMSPGLFDEDGLSKTVLSFRTLRECIDAYDGMSEEEAHTEYMQFIKSLSWSRDFSFAYASAFAYDEDGKAPYILLPERDEAGTYSEDDVWALYEAGYGNLPEKIERSKSNLQALEHFVIEYGESDEFTWIPEGCNYFSRLLEEQGITHELVTFEGNHQGFVKLRIKDAVIPYFSAVWQEDNN